MKTVTYKEYSDDLINFINKHSAKSELADIHTSPFQNGLYHKSYIFADGSEFTEVNRIRKVEAEAETKVANLRFTILIELVEHEYWSTDDSESKYWYEKV